MEWIVLEGLKPYDGRYEFDSAGSPDELFTKREYAWIKRFSSYLPANVWDGYVGGDADLYACFALIALHRAGRVQAAGAAEFMEWLDDQPWGQRIRLESDTPAVEEDADTGRPPVANSPERSPSSGAGSTTSSETLNGPQNGAGMPGSAISEWPPIRSATSPQPS